MSEAIPDRWAQMRDLPSHPEMSVFPDREPRIRHQDVRDEAHALSCPSCNYNLTGNTGAYCPECGIDLAYEPVEVFSAGDLSLVWAAAMVLDQEEISNLIVVGSLDAVAGLFTGRQTVPRLMAPFKFYYDAVDALDRRFGKRSFKAGERPPQTDVGPEWTCPACNESNPSGFEVCWQCNHDRSAGRDAPSDD